METHNITALYSEKFVRSTLSLSVAICLFGHAVQAQTQENKSAKGNIDIERITVAQKRSQSTQDVGVAVTAMGGDQIEALGFNTTQDIVMQVPGLQMQSFTPGFTTFNLRGISQNNFQDNLEAPVAVYYDDIYVGSMNALNMQMFDMSSTEVLRGPQGTLFGRNATGGLINFIPKKAQDDDFNGYAKVTLAERNTKIFEGAIGGSFSDRIRGRLAARSEKADGYIRPGMVEPGVLGEEGFTATGREANGADGYVVRANIEAALSEGTTLDLSATVTKDKDAPAGQYVVRFSGADPITGFGTKPGPIITGDPHRHASDFTGNGLDRESDIYVAKLKHEFESGTQFDYIYGYLDVFKDHQEDAGAGLVYFPFSTQAEYQQSSHELRFSGEFESTRWQTGLYALDIDFDGLAITGGPGIVGDPTGEVHQDTEMTSENWSVFGQIEYDLSDEFTIISGLRYSQDDKKIGFINTAQNFSPEANVLNDTVLFDVTEAIAQTDDPRLKNVNRIDYGDWAGKLQLDYKGIDNTLIYGSVNRGIKGGNWSPNSSVTLQDFRHDEEVLYSYEIGMKTSLLNNKGRLNSSVFYYDYQDYQAFSLTSGTAQVTNSDAFVYGGEVEFAYVPDNNWFINVGLSYLESEVDFVPGVNIGTGNYNVELPQAPRFSVNTVLRYNAELDSGNLALQLDGNWNDEQFMEGSNSEASVQDAYSVVNLRATYTLYSDSDWEASLWVKNIFDEDYLVYNLDLGFLGFIEQVYAPPRQVGVSLKYEFY